MKSFLLYLLVTLCFIDLFFQREIYSGIPYQEVVEVLIFLLFFVAIFTAKDGLKRINNDLVYLLGLWLLVSILEVVNPGASVMGWLAEIRPVALYPFLIVPAAFLILKGNRQLDIFLILVVVLSTLGSLYGVKQLHWLSNGDRQFIVENPTHMIWGRLRVFSFYNDAGQFGASQAAVGLMTLILALGPFKKWKRIALLACSGLMFYGMLASGTRGALFALVVGAFVAIVLFKKAKPLIIGGILLLGFLCFLKFTHIGDGNYQIFRLRTALDPQDPSLNLRLQNQLKLSAYMSTRPFGGGLGVIGFNARYNRGAYLATVAPDSYFVKVWAMYGIVGITIWLSIMLYILGKCSGIVWKIEDRALRVKLIALTAGFAGILFCSYGNEVINIYPSSVVCYISWVLIYMGPELEKAPKSNLLN